MPNGTSSTSSANGAREIPGQFRKGYDVPVLNTSTRINYVTGRKPEELNIGWMEEKLSRTSMAQWVSCCTINYEGGRVFRVQSSCR